MNVYKLLFLLQKRMAYRERQFDAQGTSTKVQTHYLAGYREAMEDMKEFADEEEKEEMRRKAMVSSFLPKPPTSGNT